MANGNTTDFYRDLKLVSRSPERLENYLPGTTVQSHASNLLLLDDGELLCVWFGGTQEGSSDISIWLSRLKSGATEWTEALKVSEDPERSEQNPILFQEPESGNILLFYTAQPAGQQDKSIVRKRVSTDKGLTWGPVGKAFSDIGVFIRQPIVVKEDGTWLLGVWHCQTPEGTQWNGNDDYSAVKYTTDRGATWQESTVPESRGTCHMNIRKTPAGDYAAFYRSRWADNIYQSASKDGITWTKPQPTSLPNPNSGICFDFLPNGRLAIVYNDSAAKEGMKQRTGLYDDLEGDKLQDQPAVDGKKAVWGTPRAKLTLGLSDDLGKTWRTRLLEEGDGFCLTNNSKDKINRELSYPSIAVESNGTVHIAYTYFRQRIKYVRIRSDYLG